MENPAGLIDHTLLSPVATAAQIATLCEEAVEYGFASVCVPPVYAPRAAELLYGSTVRVGSVVSFPCGYSSSRQKIQETVDLIAAGVEEIDMVAHIGGLLGQGSVQVEEEIAQVVMAARQTPVKVIIECCYLTPDLMRQATEMVVRAGAAYVKTSTGYGPSGAVLDDVRLLVKTAAGRIGVKAAGGIRTLQECRDFIAAGASRIGTSSGIEIVNQWKNLQSTWS